MKSEISTVHSYDGARRKGHGCCSSLAAMLSREDVRDPKSVSGEALAYMRKEAQELLQRVNDMAAYRNVLVTE